MTKTKLLFFLFIPIIAIPVRSIELKSVEQIKVDKGPNRVLMVDVNNDGIKEVILSNHPVGTVSLFVIDKAGKISLSKIYSVGVNPTEIVAYDMNRDGFKDILIANHETNSFHILFNDNKGGFDGKGIKKFSVETRPHIHTIGAGDFNGDKIPDVVIDSWENSRLAVYYGTSEGKFASAPAIVDVAEQPRTNLVTGDIDGDHLTDIVTPASRHGGASVILGRTINSSRLIKNDDKAFQVKLVDANNDGNSDVLTIHRGSNFNDTQGEGISLLLGDGKGDFKMAKEFPMTISGSPSSVASGDVNGDGFPEIITTNYRTNNITLLYLDKKKNKYHQITYKVGLRPESIAIGDINGDGLNEVVVANRESDSISLFQFASSNKNQSK